MKNKEKRIIIKIYSDPFNLFLDPDSGNPASFRLIMDPEIKHQRKINIFVFQLKYITLKNGLLSMGVRQKKINFLITFKYSDPEKSTTYLII